MTLALFCPTCGARTEVVRRIVNNMYELACSSCERQHVVLLDDFQKLPAASDGPHSRDAKQNKRSSGEGVPDGERRQEPDGRNEAQRRRTEPSSSSC